MRLYFFLIFYTILAIRNLKKRTANSRSRAFAAVRERSPPFAAVRRRSQWFAVVRSGSPPFAVSLKLNIRYSFNKIRETKNIKSLFLILKINNFELKKIVFKMKNFKKGNCLISWSSTSNTDYFKSFQTHSIGFKSLNTVN